MMAVPPWVDPAMRSRSVASWRVVTWRPYEADHIPIRLFWINSRSFQERKQLNSAVRVIDR
jgi:hypothetical protein